MRKWKVTNSRLEEG